MTLSIDGWTDISGYSLYALLLLRGQYVKQFINILDLNLKRHTAENIYEAVKKCMQRKQISFQNICAIVTDSPSVMIKFQTLLTRDHPHIMRVHCILHAFNLIAKDFMNHPMMASIIKGNKMLVNYFTSSSFWSEYLSQWADENEIRHGLSTLCESRWYSLAKVCLSIQSHEEGFKKCLILFQNPSSDTPTISSAVISIIENRNHFTSNNTKLGDVWKEFSTVFKAIQSIHVYERFQGFKEHCLRTLHRRAKVFHSDLYIIAYFLHPKFRSIAVSLKHSLKSITVMILVLAKDWQYYKEDAELLIPQIKRYYSQHEPFGSPSHGVFTNNAIDYWLGLPDSPQCLPLKKLAITICEIVPHAAGVEGLFSVMSAIKTKYRNKMLPNTLKMISQIKLHLLQEDSTKTKSTKFKNKECVADSTDYDYMVGFDFFSSPLELETFEEGVFGQENMEEPSRQDAFIDTLFDFDLWEQENQQ
ncbi:hypothetical protein O181_071254, partial [Austropuccinia psidii MF-1]|nr:hypothetical protein [Austropuccinia psidii MF-1]